MAISQRALAARLGVSDMTVSRALRGENGINAKTRRRILEAARKAGLPLPPSERMVAQSGRLHLLCSLAPSASVESAFHGRLLAGLQRGAGECAAELINCQPGQNGSWPLVVTRGHVDGIVVVWGDEHNRMPHADCPVPAGFIFYGPPHADVVNADNFGGGFDLGRHLAGLGHRRVAYLGSSGRISLERLAGLRAGLGIDGGDCPSDLTVARPGAFDESPALLDALLERTGFQPGKRRPFTALMAYNDFIAGRIVMRLRERGLRVPEDLSVVGFDGATPAWYDGPALTTCAMPIEELGAEAARLIYWRLEHPNAVRRKLALETELVEGKSAGMADTRSCARARIKTF